MPLNTQRDDDSSERRPSGPEPIIPIAKEKGPPLNRIIGIVFFVLVLAAVVFLLYTYGVFNPKRKAKPPETTTQNVEPVKPPPAPVTVTPETTAQAPAQIASQDTSQPVPVAVEKKLYTIYIGSYQTRNDAETEVSRWKEAGYDSFVYDIPGWSRVALGHFASIAEAKTLVDSLQQSFEQGYWIGPG